MLGASARRLTGAMLLVGAAATWVALGAPGAGGAPFGSPPGAGADAAPAIAGATMPGPEGTGGDRGPATATARTGTSEGADRTAPPGGEVAGSDAPPPFTTTEPRGAVDRATWPVAVDIPRLAVSAPVEAVGRSSVGELVVPHSPMDVGWYQGGSVPGEPGVALLTSHVDTRTEGRGVFAGLVELVEDDTVTITTADGVEQQWRVTARTQHRKDELPPALFARSGAPVLALVTCGGPFDREARSYRDNVIVWAEPSP